MSSRSLALPFPLRGCEGGGGAALLVSRAGPSSPPAPSRLAAMGPALGPAGMVPAPAETGLLLTGAGDAVGRAGGA